MISLVILPVIIMARFIVCLAGKEVIATSLFVYRGVRVHVPNQVNVNVRMAGKELCVTLVLSIQVVFMVLATSHGNATV